MREEGGGAKERKRGNERKAGGMEVGGREQKTSVQGEGTHTQYRQTDRYI